MYGCRAKIEETCYTLCSCVILTTFYDAWEIWCAKILDVSLRFFRFLNVTEAESSSTEFLLWLFDFLNDFH